MEWEFRIWSVPSFCPLMDGFLFMTVRASSNSIPSLWICVCRYIMGVFEPTCRGWWVLWMVSEWDPGSLEASFMVMHAWSAIECTWWLSCRYIGVLAKTWVSFSGGVGAFAVYEKLVFFELVFGFDIAVCYCFLFFDFFHQYCCYQPNQSSPERYTLFFISVITVTINYQHCCQPYKL